jgi:peptidoglycan/LPS O-acetylase OafA/YrhL
VGETVGLSVLAVFFAAWVVIAMRAAPGAPLHGFFANRALRTLGKYSYAMYLFHGLLREPLYRRLSPYLLNSPTEMTWSMRLVFILLGSGVSFLAALLS